MQLKKILYGLMALGATGTLVPTLALATYAPNSASVLILEPTVMGGGTSDEAISATAHGLTPVVVSAATWSAMSAGEFASYRAIILGDNNCDYGDASAAEANRTTWSAVINGNIVINGTDPVFHNRYGGDPGALQMTDSSVAFAASRPGKTGLYVSLSCYFHGTAATTPVPLLDQIGTFTVTGVGCYNNAHIVATHPALTGLTDAAISNWECSVHEAFDGFPASFIPLAIANGIAQGAISFPDGSSGPPYIVARGETLIPVGCGNAVVEAGEQCDDGNQTAGDGCSPQCKYEVCGNGIVDPGEKCDDGGTISGDGCSSTCQNEACGDGTVQPLLGEQCDDADTVSCDGCSSSCQLEVCGNEIVDCGETCDDGNLTAGDGCSATCQVESVPTTTLPQSSCGDGIVEGEEACDDGNRVGGDCCAADCTFEPVESVCGAAVCQNAGHCDGAGGCVGTAAAPVGTPCGDASTSPCDSADTCDGQGLCQPNNTEDGGSCEDNVYCNGTDLCQAGVCTHVSPPCGTGECVVCNEDANTCDNVAGDTACADDGNECTDDSCDGQGDCIHPPIALSPLCEWAVVGGTDTQRSTVRTRYNAEISGAVCADKGDLGEGTRLRVAPGSEKSVWAFTEDTGNSAKVRADNQVENGRVLTGGGCLASVASSLMFGTSVDTTICCEDSPVELPGGIAANVIDACGLDPKIEECRGAKGRVSSDVALLDSLSSTRSLGNVALAPQEVRTIALDPGRNVIDIDKLVLNQSSILVLDAQGHADAVAILRLARGMSSKVKASVQVAGGLSPENLIFYASGGNCAIGWNNTGVGALFCPQGKVRLQVDTIWTGSIVGGNGVDIGWSSSVIQQPFLGLAH